MRVREGLDEIVETVIYLVTESRRISKDVASRYGVTPTQLTVLKLLCEMNDTEGFTLGRLSRQIRAHNSTVTGIVDRMEAAGLVERARSRDDRRAWIIRLTTQGRRIARAAPISPWDLLRNALHALSPLEQTRLTEILKRMATHIGGQVEEAANAPAARDRRRGRRENGEEHGAER